MQDKKSSEKSGIEGSSKSGSESSSKSGIEGSLKSGFGSIKKKIVAIVIGAAVLVAVVVPISLAQPSPTIEEQQEGIVLKNWKGPKPQYTQTVAPEEQSSEQNVIIVGETANPTSIAVQGALGGEITADGDTVGIIVTKSPEPIITPQPTMMPSVHPSSTPTLPLYAVETEAVEVPNSEKIIESSARPQATKQPAASGQSLEEETIFKEEIVPAASGVDIEESTIEEEPPAEIDSFEVSGVVQGEDFDGDMESLMQKPIETRVGLMQQRLMELGYMEADPVPEIYDAQTQLAVMYFQRSHSINITGVADYKTYDKIMEDSSLPYGISIGTQGEDVRIMQENLSALGQGVSISGIFDQVTSDSVEVFCTEKGLEYTGVVDIDIRRAISSEAAIRGVTYAPPVANQPNMGTPVLNTNIENFIASATAQLGKTYVLGGKGPDVFDCSGLIYYCLNQVGYDIDYMTSGGWAASSYPSVNSLAELVRGDVVCFNGHVGIYLGNGRMLDASSSQGEVRVSSELASSGYWTSNFLSGKRIF